jgi:hypothetical protein
MDEVKQAMLALAKKLRSAAYWCDDGYYSTLAESASNSAKRDVYEEIASSIDRAFDIDFTLTREEAKRGF